MPDIQSPFESLTFFADFEPPLGDFRADVLAGLSAPQKAISPKYFYDEIGSNLFDEICHLAEYYPTRTELKILSDCGPVIAEAAGADAAVLEYGSGASVKIRTLLDALPAARSYIGVDISRGFLLESTKALAAAYPQLSVGAVCADFTQPFELPEAARHNVDHFLGFFPGSTIGNLSRDGARDFLREARTTLGPRGALLVGVDLKKDPDMLTAAYNDAKGLTAEFNLNLLRRINRELEAEIDVEAFEHHAFYNEAEGRIEMHLRAVRDIDIAISGRRFMLEKGETIHTENSHKYSIEEFQNLAENIGFRASNVWTDDNTLFSIHLLRSS